MGKKDNDEIINKANKESDVEDVKADNENSEEIVDEKVKGSEESSADEASKTDTPEGEEALEDAEESSEDKEDGPSKKVKKDKKDEKIEELEDRVKRQMAEFENYRKRTEKEKSSMYEMGAKSVIEKMLPVVDNFERGLQSIPAEQKDSAIAQGMQMIYKQIMTEFDNMGVKAIETVGNEFNPELHNAVMQVESDEYESGIIAQELQKGYTYRDSVVRHSMVAVAQ